MSALVSKLDCYLIVKLRNYGGINFRSLHALDLRWCLVCYLVLFFLMLGNPRTKIIRKWWPPLVLLPIYWSPQCLVWHNPRWQNFQKIGQYSYVNIPQTIIRSCPILLQNLRWNVSWFYSKFLHNWSYPSSWWASKWIFFIFWLSTLCWRLPVRPLVSSLVHPSKILPSQLNLCRHWSFLNYYSRDFSSKLVWYRNSYGGRNICVP